MNILYDERLDGPLPQVDKDGLLAELRLRLPDLELLHAAEDLRPYECDGLSAYRCTPLLVALPERIEQVQGLLALCHRLKVPVVARGAGTGLSGGALPLENGVLLVMARFRRILGSIRWVVSPGSSLACATWRSPRPLPLMVCTTHRTRPRRSPAPSAATSRRTPAACIA